MHSVSCNAVAAALVLVLAMPATHAAVTAEEARQLGGPQLTAWGAEQAGNKDATIPAWSDERIKAPADYDASDATRLPDPWKDKPLFSITAQNASRYADRLTEGQKALFRRYPDFRMDVYASRRTARFPKWILEATRKNATSCRTESDGLRLAGCWGGIVFPIPKSGNEVMWNHITRYQMPALHGLNTQWVSDNTGHAVLTASQAFDAVYPFHDPKRTAPAASDSVYYKLRFDLVAPTRKVGEKYVLLWSLDNVTRAYVYVPGQRRVKLAPDLAYDTPAPGSAGAMTMDESQVFLGALDRYDFKLVGKQEKYIMYNTYNLFDWKTCPNERILATAHFPNPDCARWELHRQWVVAASLKPGFRHILPKRTFYFDEDGFGVGMSDDFDQTGSLYRTVQGYSIQQFYNNPGDVNYADCSVGIDLQTGIYSPQCLHGAKGHGIVETAPKPDLFFSPDALAGEGIR